MANEYGFSGTQPDKPRSMADMGDLAEKERQKRNEAAGGKARPQSQPKTTRNTAPPSREMIGRAAINAERIKQLPEIVQQQELALLSTDPVMRDLVQKHLDEHKARQEDLAEQQKAVDEAASQPISEEAAAAYGASQGQFTVAMTKPAIAPQHIDYNRDGMPDNHANTVSQGSDEHARRRSGVAGDRVERQDSIGYRQRLADREKVESEFDEALNSGADVDQGTGGLSRDKYGNADIGANDPGAVIAKQPARTTESGGNPVPPESGGTEASQSTPGVDPRIAANAESPQVRPAVAGDLQSGSGQVSPAPSPADAAKLATDKPQPAPTPRPQVQPKPQPAPDKPA
jgi:hypothetical protein